MLFSPIFDLYDKIDSLILLFDWYDSQLGCLVFLHTLKWFYLIFYFFSDINTTKYRRHRSTVDGLQTRFYDMLFDLGFLLKKHFFLAYTPLAVNAALIIYYVLGFPIPKTFAEDDVFYFGYFISIFYITFFFYTTSKLILLFWHLYDFNEYVFLAYLKRYWSRDLILFCRNYSYRGLHLFVLVYTTIYMLIVLFFWVCFLYNCGFFGLSLINWLGHPFSYTYCLL